MVSSDGRFCGRDCRGRRFAGGGDHDGRSGRGGAGGGGQGVAPRRGVACLPAAAGRRSRRAGGCGPDLRQPLRGGAGGGPAGSRCGSVGPRTHQRRAQRRPETGRAAPRPGVGGGGRRRLPGDSGRGASGSGGEGRGHRDGADPQGGAEPRGASFRRPDRDLRPPHRHPRLRDAVDGGGATRGARVHPRVAARGVRARHPRAGGDRDPPGPRRRQDARLRAAAHRGGGTQPSRRRRRSVRQRGGGRDHSCDPRGAR